MSKFPRLFEVSWISEIARKIEILDFTGNLDALAPGFCAAAQIQKLPCDSHYDGARYSFNSIGRGGTQRVDYSSAFFRVLCC